MSAYINLKFCVYIYPNMRYSMPRYDFVKIDLNSLLGSIHVPLFCDWLHGFLGRRVVLTTVATATKIRIDLFSVVIV